MTFPYKNRWALRQQFKKTRFWCPNCFRRFHTGKVHFFAEPTHDDICPWCGCQGMTFDELIDAHVELIRKIDNERRPK